MTNLIEWKQEKRVASKMETINQTQPLYLCVDCEKEAEQYCKDNYCTISFYPIGTYSEIE